MRCFRPKRTDRRDVMDHATLATLRDRHPAWRLLASPHAPLVASFLQRVYVVPNVRVMSEADLAEALEDELFALREQLGPDAYPKGALEYLTDWASTDKGWLRKFYKPGTDEAQFDLTPATERAIAWLASLTERPFVGTESRLLTLFALLEQISAGTEGDPLKRAADLRKKRDETDAEIRRVLAGDVPLLDDTAVKDRFLQFQQTARELLADFREVEQNFRLLDRKVREKIALWEGSKGALLDEIMGERDAIGDSDQGRSFRAFWDFLMSSQRQEELSERLDHVLALPAVAALKPEPRTRRVHHDWLEAGEHTQRTVAQLSQQLRRFLDDRAFLENRRILDLLHGIESKALAVRESMPAQAVMHIEEMGAAITLSLERPLFTPSAKTRLADLGAGCRGGGHRHREAFRSDRCGQSATARGHPTGSAPRGTGDAATVAGGRTFAARVGRVGGLPGTGPLRLCDRRLGWRARSGRRERAGADSLARLRRQG